MAKKIYKANGKIIIKDLIIETGSFCPVDLISLSKVSNSISCYLNHGAEITDFAGIAKIYVDKGNLKADIELCKDIVQFYPSLAGLCTFDEAGKVTSMGLKTLGFCTLVPEDRQALNLVDQLESIEIEGVETYIFNRVKN